MLVIEEKPFKSVKNLIAMFLHLEFLVGVDGCVSLCCLRYVFCQIFDPSGIVVIKVVSCCCIPYRYDFDTPFVVGDWCFFADPEGGGGMSEIGSWYIYIRECSRGFVALVDRCRNM